MYIYNKKPAVSNERIPPVSTITGNRPVKNPVLSPPPPRNDRTGPSDTSRPEPVPAYINLLILSVLVFGFDTGLKMTSKWVYSENLRVSLEKENVETQLIYLKNQISPHFFMDTLNNIHSLIDIDVVRQRNQ
jgi:hypothetical protein